MGFRTENVLKRKNKPFESRLSKIHEYLSSKMRKSLRTQKIDIFVRLRVEDIQQSVRKSIFCILEKIDRKKTGKKHVLKSGSKSAQKSGSKSGDFRGTFLGQKRSSKNGLFWSKKRGQNDPLKPYLDNPET